MEFTTIVLGHKKSQVILEAKEKYKLFDLDQDDFVIKNNIFRIDEGRNFYDFIGDQGPLKFMSERFKYFLEINNVKGIKFYPICIEETDLKYFFFKTNTCNSFYDKDEDGDRIYGTFKVDITSWDGSDIFYLRDSGATVCTMRVKKYLKMQK